MPQGLVLHTCYQNAFLGMTWLLVAVANPKSLDNTVTPWKLKAWTFTLKCWQFLAFHFFLWEGGKGVATSTWHLPLERCEISIAVMEDLWRFVELQDRWDQFCFTCIIQLTIKLERIYFYSSRSNYLSFCLFQTLLKSFLNKYLCSIIIIFSWKKKVQQTKSW